MTSCRGHAVRSLNQGIVLISRYISEYWMLLKCHLIFRYIKYFQLSIKDQIERNVLTHMTMWYKLVNYNSIKQCTAPAHHSDGLCTHLYRSHDFLIRVDILGYHDLRMINYKRQPTWGFDYKSENESRLSIFSWIGQHEKINTHMLKKAKTKVDLRNEIHEVRLLEITLVGITTRDF